MPPFNSQQRIPLFEALKQNRLSPTVSFFAPGHKQGKGTPKSIDLLLGNSVFQSDFPDLPGLNLFDPQGVLAEAQQLAAEAFGADRTWFLVNGTSVGAIASILATCNPGEKIILPRNIHQSAISGLILSGAKPIFVLPEYDSELDLIHCLTPDSIELSLEQHPDTKAVFMLSPTYQAVCGDIAAIGKIARDRGIPLIVDEAHGAHFRFHPDLPTPALEAGADLVMQSTHKVLSSLTQSSMLHLRGDRIEANRLDRSLQILQSTSPSNVLLASLDATRHQFATQGKELTSRTLRLADLARSRLQQIPGLAVLERKKSCSPGFRDLDPTRLTVFVSGLGMDGFTIDRLLQEQFNVTPELPLFNHVTFIITSGNSETDIDRLVEAFEKLAESASNNAVANAMAVFAPTLAPLGCLPRKAFFAPTESIPLKDAIERLCAESICPYPPGIPLLLPGEIITAEAIELLQRVISLGGFVTGAADENLETIEVVKTNYWS
jgi:arginine/lysine/ornithine decarboxylase